MKKKFMISLVLIMLLSIFIIILVNNKLINTKNDEYEFVCEYKTSDPMKDSIHRYIINTDKFLLVNKIEHESIYEYKENSRYKEAKEYFIGQKFEFKYDDKNNKIYDIYSIDNRIYNNQSYHQYINNIDTNYKCEQANLENIIYKCTKDEENKNISYEEIYTIESDNQMNVDKINRYELLKFFNEEIYNTNKKQILDENGKRYEDSTKSIISEQEVPLIDENGEKYIINIKNYVDNIKDEYDCKIVRN